MAEHVDWRSNPKKIKENFILVGVILRVLVESKVEEGSFSFGRNDKEERKCGSQLASDQ